MADVMRELERLRPVYETGVLRLLLRQNAMLYVSLLRSTFDPLTGELPRETVEERFAKNLCRQSERSGRRRRICAARGPDLRRGRSSDPRRPDP